MHQANVNRIAAKSHDARSRELEPFVRRIVEAHGGSIAVHGETGEGNTCAFTIPVHNESCADIRWSAA